MVEVKSALKLEAGCQYAAGTPADVVTRNESLAEGLQTKFVGTSLRKALTAVMCPCIEYDSANRKYSAVNG